MSDDENNEDYEVGYRKPPKASQFKPGQSGNRKGRPKGARGLRTIIAEDAATRITVREGGKTKRKSKLDLLVQATSSRAIKGDMRANGQYLALVSRYLPDEGEDRAEERLSPEDQAILDAMKKRFASNHPPISANDPAGRWTTSPDFDNLMDETDNGDGK